MDCKKSNEKLSQKDSDTKVHSSSNNKKPNKKCNKSSERINVENPVTIAKSATNQEVPIDTKEKPPCNKTQQEKNVLDVNNETLINLKHSIHNIATKVFDKTKDVVTVIKSESAKQLENLKSGGINLENIKAEGAKHFETIKTEGVKHLETIKTEGAKHLETIKTEGAKHLETLKIEGAKHFETVKTEGAKHFENLKTESVKHLENLRTESAKQLENFKKSKSSWTGSECTKSSNKNGSETTTSFNFFSKTDNQNEKSDNNIESNPTVQDIGKDVGAKISALSQKISENWSDVFKFNDFDKSSPYDVPITKHDKPPKQVSNVIDTEAFTVSNSVFSAIKSKVYSLFSEPEMTSNNESLKSSSSSSSCREDNDD